MTSTTIYITKLIKVEVMVITIIKKGDYNNHKNKYFYKFIVANCYII